LEELEGEMPGGDPFAPGADDTKGMDVLEQEEFMKALALRRQRWNDPETVNFDPKDIKEEKAIDSMVTGYLFTGTFESDANKASVVAVKRHADLKRRAEAHLKGPGTDPALEEFHSSRAEQLMLAGNRLPASRTNPLHIFDKEVAFDEPGNRQRQRTIEQELVKLARIKKQTAESSERQKVLERELSELKNQVFRNHQIAAQFRAVNANMGEEMPQRIRRTYQYEATQNAAKPRGLKRIKTALQSGPKEDGETEIEVAV